VIGAIDQKISLILHGLDKIQIKTPKGFLPTVFLAEFQMQCDMATAEKALKTVLYTGKKKIEEAMRFQLSRHGVLD